MKEVEKMIADALQSFAGDVAEYINYYNDRLSVVEDKLGITVQGYPDHLEKYYEGEPKRPEPRRVN
jgi:hypothetical protein